MKRVTIIVFTVCIMAQVFGLYQFIVGSQEMFPTPGQEEAVRITGIMLFCFALIPEIILIMLRKKISKTKARKEPNIFI
ncbi:MAG TPA: hypothetical protein VEC13_02460 [Candidatus Paceibacterota bacterium]|nr:hypothetical protein [Candidatus Paceibacterota bacterium]